MTVRMMALRPFAMPGAQGHAWPADEHGQGGSEFMASGEEARKLVQLGLAKVLDDEPGARETKPAKEPARREKK